MKRLNFKRKYLTNNPVHGEMYVVSNKTMQRVRDRVNSTWITEGEDPYKSFGYHFTDSYPFVMKYAIVYDLKKQIEDKDY